MRRPLNPWGERRRGGGDGGPGTGEAANDFSGAGGSVVQAGSISGDVVVQGGGPPRRPTPRQIQQRSAGFVDRDRELSYLDGLLTRSDEIAAPMLVVLSGSPGVGKTALAVEWAHRHREDFPDGSLFADLHGFDQSRPTSREEIFDTFLRALGASPMELPGALDAQIAMFRTLVEGRRILIVLDDAASADEVRSFMAGSRSLLLVTSRHRLSGLSARDGAHALTLDTLPPDDAALLIAQTVGPERTHAESGAVGQLVRDCACLPLALRIAAEQVRTRPYLSMTEHVRDLRANGRLESLAVEGDEKSQIKTVFSWSYRALKEQSARMFRFLGLHPGRDIGLGAIGALCQLDDQSTRRSVRELLSMNLLSESAGDRYNFHDLLRVYSRDLIKGTDTMNEQDEATRRLIDWYVASADNADALLSPGRSLRDDIRTTVEGRRFESYDDALSWMESERANLIDIVRRAGEIGEHHSAAVIPNLMWTYFNVTKHWADWITCNEIGLASARRSGDKRSEAYLQTSQGVAHGSLRHTELAIEAHSRAIGLFEEVGEVDGLGYAHNNLANAYNDAGRYEQAIAHYRKAIAVFVDVSDPRRGQGMALNGLALCFLRMERYTDSLETARRAYTTARETGHTFGAAVALNTTGRAEAGLGRLDRAARTLREALALRRKAGDRQGTARSLTVLGQVYADHGRRDDSLDAWSEALAIFTELGSPERADVAMRLRG